MLLMAPRYRSTPSPYPYAWGRFSYHPHVELKPLAKLHEMDLLPFVKELWIWSLSFEPWFSPRRFNRQSLRHFSTLTSVQQLRIERFGLPKFVSRHRTVFRTFRAGIMIHLPRDHDNSCISSRSSQTQAVPFSVPSLRGQLKLTHVPSETVFSGYNNIVQGVNVPVYVLVLWRGRDCFWELALIFCRR